MRRLRRPAAPLAGLLLALAAAAPAAAQTPLPLDGLRLVGVAGSGLFTPLPVPTSEARTTEEAISDDGRYVVFRSGADGLRDDDADTAEWSIYRKDRVTGDVLLVSRVDGTDAPSDSFCDDPSISDDGDRIAFRCSQDLTPGVGGAQAPGAGQVYVRDVTDARTYLASRLPGADGGRAPNGASEPRISGDGAHVAFVSFGLNGVSGFHIWRRTLAAGTTRLVDRPTTTTPNGNAFDPSISDDGTKVAYRSQSSNIAVNDTDTGQDLFVTDLSGAFNTVQLVNVVDGSPSPGTRDASTAPSEPELSGDGAFVAYVSNAADAVAPATAGDEVHRRRLSDTDVRHVSRRDDGTELSGAAYSPTIDDDGTRVGFLANDGLGEQGTGSFVRQAFVRRITALGDTTDLVSRATGSAGPISTADATAVALSGDGLVAAVVAQALTPDADPFTQEVFARAISPDTTSMVSRPPGTAPFVNLGGQASLPDGGGLSAGGRYAVLTARAAGLPDAPATPHVQVWRRDNLTGDVVLVSRATDGTPADGPSFDPTISADGTKVAFTSAGTNLGAAQSGLGYVRDLAAGTTTVASRGPDGTAVQPGDLQLAAGGGHVAFTSADAPLSPDGRSHVFVRDLAAGTTAGTALGQAADAREARVSADGRRVTWYVELEDGFTDKAFWADTGGEAVAVDQGTSAAPDDDVTNPAISGDGTKVVFSTEAGLLAADTNPGSDLYVRDLGSGALALATVGPGGQAGEFSSGGVLDHTGARVLFRQSATTWAPGDANGEEDLWLRDLTAGTTTLVSRADGPSGALAAGIVSDPSLDATGTCAVFSTRATNFGTGLQPGVTRAWLRAVRGTCAAPPAIVGPGLQPAPPGGGGGGGGGGTTTTPGRPALSAVSASRTRFRSRGRKPLGTTFRFRVDRAATVEVVLSRVLAGRRSGGRCLAGAPRKGQRRCERLRRVVTLRRTLKAAGRGTVAFSGKVRGRAVPAGRYRAVVRARGDGGTSRAVTLKLVVVRR